MPKHVKPSAKRQKSKKCKESSVPQSCSIPATEKNPDVCSDLATNTNSDNTNSQQSTALTDHGHDLAAAKSCSNHKVIPVQTSEAEQNTCDMPASIPSRRAEVDDEKHTITTVKEKQEKYTDYRGVGTSGEEVVSPCKSPKFFSQSSSTKHHDKPVSLYHSHRKLLAGLACNINQPEIIPCEDITESKCQAASSALACSLKRKQWSQQLFSSQPQPKKFKPPIKSESFPDHKEETPNILVDYSTGKPDKEDLTNVQEDQLINNVVLKSREYETQAIIKVKDTVHQTPSISSTIKEEDDKLLCEIAIMGDVGKVTELKSDGSELQVVEDITGLSVKIPGTCILEPPLSGEDRNKVSANTHVHQSVTKDFACSNFPRNTDINRLLYHQETLVMTPDDSLQVLIPQTFSSLPYERPKISTTDEVQIKGGSLNIESFSDAKTASPIPENQSSPNYYQHVVIEKHCIELPQKCVSSETQFTDLIDRFDLNDTHFSDLPQSSKISHSLEQLNRCTNEIPLSERPTLRSEIQGGTSDTPGSEMQGGMSDTPRSEIQGVTKSTPTPNLEIQDTNSTARSEIQDVLNSTPISEVLGESNTTPKSGIQDTNSTAKYKKQDVANRTLRSERKGEMNCIPRSEMEDGIKSAPRSEIHDVTNFTLTSYPDPVCVIPNSTRKQVAGSYTSDNSNFLAGLRETEDRKEDTNIATSHKDHLNKICDQSVFSSAGSCSMHTERNDPEIDTVTLTQETNSSPLLSGETIKYNQCPNSDSQHSQDLNKTNDQKQNYIEMNNTLQFAIMNDLTEQKTISKIVYSSGGSQHFFTNQEFQHHAKVVDTHGIDLSKPLMEPSVNHSKASDRTLSASVYTTSDSNVKDTCFSEKDNSKICINLRSPSSSTDFAQNVLEAHNTLSACSTAPQPVEILATTKDVSCNKSLLDAVSSYSCNKTEPFSIQNVPKAEALCTDKHIRNLAIKSASCSTDTASINQNYFHFSHNSIPHMSDFPSASKGNQSLINITDEGETANGSINYEKRMSSMKQNVDLLADLSNSQIHQLETEDFDNSSNFFQDQTAPRSESLDNFECQLSSNMLKSKNDLETRKVEGNRLVKTIQADLVSVNRQLMRLKREMETVRRILQQQHKPGMQNKHGFGFV